MYRFVIGLLFVFGLHGQQIISVSTTHTQAVITFKATSPSDVCYIDVRYKGSTVNDVNNALFAWSNQIPAGELVRTVVVGKQRVDVGIDGHPYSRALVSDAYHTFEIDCGSGPVGGSFVTASMPTGVAKIPSYQGVNGVPLFPSLLRTANLQKYVDPFTGVEFERLPLDIGIYPESNRNGNGVEKGNNWTNPSNAVTEDSTYASTTTNDSNLDVVFFYSYSETSNPLYNIRLEARAYASAANQVRIRACRVNRFTDDCDGLTYESNLIGTSPTYVSIPASLTTPDVWQYPLNITNFDQRSYGPGRVWTNGSSTTVYFSSASACDGIRVNESIRSGAQNQGGAAVFTNATVTAKDCGATVPNVTVSSSVNWSGNGTNCQNVNDSRCGYPYLVRVGVHNNRAFIFRIWKVGDTGTTLFVDNVRLVMQRNVWINNSASGFHRVCSPLADPTTGFVLCGTGTRIFAVHRDTGEVRNLGSAHYFLSWLGLGSGSYPYAAGNTGTNWSNTDPKSLFLAVTGSDGNSYIYKATYQGDYSNITPTWDGSWSGPPAIGPSGWTRLTNDPYKQLIANFVSANQSNYSIPFVPDDWQCGISGVAGSSVHNDLVISCKINAKTSDSSYQSIQDSIAILAVYREGTGIIAANYPHERDQTTFCVNHSIYDQGMQKNIPMQLNPAKESYNQAGSGKWNLQLSTNLSSCTLRGTCSPCPTSPLDTQIGFGIVRVTNGSTSVQGIGTLFLNHLDTGATITVAGQTRTIASITNDTQLTVDSAFTVTAENQTWTYSLANQRRCSTATFVTDPLWQDWTARAGTVSVTAGQTTVTGSGTNFLSVLRYRDLVRINGEEKMVAFINSATTFQVDSPFTASASGVTWESKYPNKPSYYANGYTPVSTNYPRFVANVRVGNVVTSANGEDIRLVKDNGNGSWVVQRAVGRPGTTGATVQSHNSGILFWANCKGGIYNTSAVDRDWEMRWFYEQDPYGTNIAYTKVMNWITGHLIAGPDFVITDKYNITTMNMDVPGNFDRDRGDKAISASSVSMFGASAPCEGNSCEFHPTAVTENALEGWKDVYYDHNPFLGTGGNVWILNTTLASAIDASALTINVTDAQYMLLGSQTTVISVNDEKILICNRTGNTLTVCVGGRGYEGSTASSHSAGSPVRCKNAMPLRNNLYAYNFGQYDNRIDPRHYSVVGISGDRVLTDKSGPNSLLSDNDSDAFRFCIALKNGECRPTSQAGMAYVNVPNAEPAFEYCTLGENYSGASDICLVDRGFIHGTVIQGAMRFPTLGTMGQYAVVDATGKRIRHVGVVNNWPRRLSIVANLKAISGQKNMLVWYNLPGRVYTYLARMPKWSGTDSVARNGYLPMKVDIGRIPGVTHAQVEYGYNENYRCSSRDDSCIANSNTLSTTLPIKFRSENYIAYDCANGCSIIVPVESGKVVYYRVLGFTNSDPTQLVYEGRQNVVTVN